MDAYKTFYNENGYLLIPNFFSEDSVDELRNESRNLIDQHYKEYQSNGQIFSTKNQVKNTGKFLIDSSDKISLFFEEHAVDEHGNLLVPKYQSINKMGHALHKYNPIFRKFTSNEKVENLIKHLGIENPIIPQSMYIFKQPNIGGYITPHQDSTFLFTTPLSCMGVWVPLEDVTSSNAPLLVLPGSHKEGIVTQFKATADYKLKYDPAPDDVRSATYEKMINCEVKEGEYEWKSLECPRGSLVIIHGSLVHMSNINKSDTSRHAYSYHIIDKNAKWSEDNWLQYTNPDSFPSFEDLRK
jgi:phytanoyl-CoA hydroxylase